MSYRVFNGETTNTTSPTVRSFKSRHTIFCWGTFGSATVKVQLSAEGTEWFDEAAITFTAKGYASIELATDTKMRAVISGGTGASLHLAIV